jgi:hypothetical protein
VTPRWAEKFILSKAGICCSIVEPHDFAGFVEPGRYKGFIFLATKKRRAEETQRIFFCKEATVTHLPICPSQKEHWKIFPGNPTWKFFDT